MSGKQCYGCGKCLSREEVISGLVLDRVSQKRMPEETPWVNPHGFSNQFWNPETGESASDAWINERMKMIGVPESDFGGVVACVDCVEKEYNFDYDEFFAKIEQEASLLVNYIDWWSNELDEIREGAYSDDELIQDVPGEVQQRIAESSSRRLLFCLTEIIWTDG